MTSTRCRLENGQQRADSQGSAPDSEDIAGTHRTRGVLDNLSMALGVVEKALCSTYTRELIPDE